MSPSSHAAAATDLLEQVRSGGHVPRHVAIIMDGNGRWARERLLPRPFGHRSGMKAVREVVQGALAAGVAHLSLFAFSNENWQRPHAEVSALMALLEEYIAREVDELADRGVRVRVLGELDRLAPSALAAVQLVESRTAHNGALTLNLFISYGARRELVSAMRAMARDVAAGRLTPEAIDEGEVGRRLLTRDMPDPDLLIRTSGEQRISNFLLWQLAYTEIYISPVFWPDFGREELFEAIRDYQRRERRFGKVSPQGA
ncbi:MAG: isoprenyl transferase [Gemmatimonadaceae bacterium]|nr:isoprenyl transferase [Gemmatimonadaceae bacterium]MCU0626724.1 isoprenyl transferase [Gemmatimonadaceae bacterium]